ncbi:MAG: MotA/TolQ/ExbB proton channel family protein [Prosthecobacter sp.]|jgi:biopolymer transport protein TolQ|uniref:MotA/TolQ/ExbB proton channel family protein n=1 Tax=Prosthecobacter sp. TaxID=1965333 RepID=UPI0019F7CD24|nr:MotA/TolQ/ExbB proton channel family protein [Prosthecobacter sp.]MBE2282253.1 MotA/TolQ/ExbB proton channel family protein [Prosthecobacter sp.]
MPPIETLLSPGLLYGLKNSNLTCWIICGILALLSVTAWAVILSKHFLLSRVHRSNLSFLREYRESNHPLELFQRREHHEYSSYYHIYHAACREMAWYLVGEDEPGDTFAARLQGAGRITPSQMSAVQVAMERSVGEAALRLEARMNWVATVLSGAPFLGLLGTVWGILDAFGLMSQNGAAADLNTLAPGITTALVTTVLGLLVAIPSMICYNGIVNRIRGMVVRLDNFASELSAGLDRTFVDHRFTNETLPSMSALGSPSMPAFTGSSASPLPAAMHALHARA